MIVAFEGIDGSGKSFTHNHLKQMVCETPNLAARYYFTREPQYDEYISLLADARTVQEKALIFAADRHRQYADIGELVKHPDVIIITDRSYISNYAYQYYDFLAMNGFKDSISTLKFMEWMKSIQPSNCAADLVVFFEARPDICVKRCAARNEPLTEDKVNVINDIYRTIIRNLGCKYINVRTDNGLNTREICEYILQEIGLEEV